LVIETSLYYDARSEIHKKIYLNRCFCSASWSVAGGWTWQLEH